MTEKYAVKHKPQGGSYFTYGNMAMGQYGNYRLGFKVGPKLKELINNTPEGQYVNFTLFPDEGPRQETPKRQESYVPELNDEVPF